MLRKMLVLLMAVMMFICISSIGMADEEPECEHVESDWIVENEATCKADGLKYKICTICKTGLVKEDIPASDELHVESDWIVEKKATCKEDGLKYKICTVCKIGLVKEDIPASDELHVESDWITENEATCMMTGLKYKICTVCKKGLIKEIIQLNDNHTKLEKTVLYEGDCQAPKHIWIACECGYIDEVKEDIDPDAHTFEDGKCKHCGAADPSFKPVCSHVAGDWIVEDEATCMETGLRYKICTLCKAGLIKELIPTNDKHVKLDKVVLNEGNCLAPKQVWVVCECGYTDTVVSDVDPDAHTFEDGVCKYCGAADPEFVPECEHNMINGGGAEANCTQTGNVVTYCTKCGHQETTATEIDPDNHHFENGVCARCGEEEELEFKPDRKPGHGKKPGNGHKPNRPSRPNVKPEQRCEHAWTVDNVVEATCTRAGSVVYICSKGCGQKYTVATYINLWKHSYGEDNICDECGRAKFCKHEWIEGEKVEANCTHEGRIVYVCAKGCGQEYTKKTGINLLNHNYGKDNICDDCAKVKPCWHVWSVGEIVYANCTHKGSIVYVCSKGCGQEYTKTTEINRRNHNYGEDNTCVDCGEAKRCRHEWIEGATVEANCTYEGSIVYVCAKGCGQENTKTTEINPCNHDYGNDNVCDDCGNIKRSRRTRMNEETEVQISENTEENENRGFEYIEETEENAEAEESESANQRGKWNSRGKNYRNREAQSAENTEETENQSFEYNEETESTSRRSMRNTRGRNNRSRSFSSDVYLTGND